MPMTAAEVLDREFLEIRAQIVTLAASLDRLDRADGDVADDQRVRRLRDALSVLQERRSDRVEQVQLAFSLPYDPRWREAFDLPPTR
jgi:hypothetical protein